MPKTKTTDSPDHACIHRPSKIYTVLGLVWFAWLGNLVLRHLGFSHLSFLPRLDDWRLSEPGVACTLVLLSAGVMVLMIFRQRAYVAITPDGFEYRGFFKCLRTSWEDVRSVSRKTEFSDLEICTVNGKTLILVGFGRDLWRDMKRYVVSEDEQDARRKRVMKE